MLSGGGGPDPGLGGGRGGTPGRRFPRALLPPAGTEPSGTGTPPRGDPRNRRGGGGNPREGGGGGAVGREAVP